MAGAIAGTAILRNLTPTSSLRTITLTVNNSCNLACPHCYLQYDQKNFLVKQPTIDSIFRASFDHLAIVGKEPLVNDATTALVANLIDRSYVMGKTVSVITNGIGLKRITPKMATCLNYVDVSFDGGPKTYSQYRKGSFAKVIEGINSIKVVSRTPVNALHTLSSGTLTSIDDMMAIRDYVDFSTIMFSPFLSTEHNGRNTVESISIGEICRTLVNSARFMDAPESLLLLDNYHSYQEGLCSAQVRAMIESEGLSAKVKFIEADPLNYGIIRVSYDDYVLTPYESIHPKQYGQSKLKASASNLNEAFQSFQDLYSMSV